MTSDGMMIQRVEALYEDLAKAIDDVREDRAPEEAGECEAQFLVKLSFLALREIGDPDRQRDLIRRAAKNLG